MRTVNRLTTRLIDCNLPPGFYADGGGLYLQVGNGNKSSWVYRYMLRGIQRDMGVGSLREVSLAEARKRVMKYRTLRSQGIDLIEARKRFRTNAKLAADRSLTFKTCAEKYITARRPSWRNAKHAAQWISTLESYVY